MKDDGWNEGVMNDEEWQKWAATYAKETQPLPPIVKRVLSDRKRGLIGLTLVYLISALLIVLEIPELQNAHTTTALMSPLLAMVLVLVLAVGVHGLTWGAFRRTGVTPLRALSDLERRHAARRRLMRFLPWITAFGVLGTMGIEAASMTAARHFDLWSAVGTIAICGVTVGLVSLTVKRVGKVIDRDLRQTAEARRLLTEGEDAP